MRSGPARLLSSLSQRAVLQRSLQQHKWAATAAVLPIDDDENRLRAVIRPRDGALRSIKDVGNALGQSVSESETLLDLTQTLLQRGELSRADFVRRYAPEAQPVAGAGMLCATSSGSATEGRIFNELLMAAFREYDSDADGFLTPPEVLTFLQGHGLHYVADRAFVPVDDNVQFGDFKSLLLDTCVLSLYASDGKIQLSKEVPLMDKVCEEFFRGADLDGNFVISPQELEVLFGRIHMASHAGTYYAVYAKEGYGGGISMDGFKHMLLGEAPEASYHDEVLTAAEYQHESFNSYRH